MCVKAKPDSTGICNAGGQDLLNHGQCLTTTLSQSQHSLSHTVRHNTQSSSLPQSSSSPTPSSLHSISTTSSIQSSPHQSNVEGSNKGSPRRSEPKDLKYGEASSSAVKKVTPAYLLCFGPRSAWIYTMLRFIFL